MTAPGDRIVVDPQALRRMITILGGLRGALQAQARMLAAHAAAVPLAMDAPAKLRAADTWAEREVTHLHRRVVLAEAADPPLRGLPRALPPHLPVGWNETSEQAAGAGRALADHLLRPDPGQRDQRRVPRVLRALGTRLADPDFLTGFFDRLGPTDLARLLHQLFGLGAEDRTHATRVLGRGLATYSRRRDLTASWLGAFNRQGRAGRVETSLLAPLFAHGRFAPALLERLGGLFFGSDPGAGALRDVGLQTDPRGATPAGRVTAARLRQDYAVALLRAIADEPRSALLIATRHLSRILGVSGLVAPDMPGMFHPPGEVWGAALEPARAALVAAAGGAAARQAQPVAAREFVARLVGLVGARPEPSPVSPHLRAAYGQVLHTWRQDLYAAVTSPLPADPSARDMPGLGLSGREWAALLRESLRGGVSAPLLAADAVSFATALDTRVWQETRGYNRPDAGHYPTSPRALAHHQSNEAVRFFRQALLDATDAELRTYATRQARHDRRTAVLLDILAETVKSIDVTSIVATLGNLGIGLTVEIVEERIRQSTAILPRQETQLILDELRATLRQLPDWQTQYRASVADLWHRRNDDPLRPVTTTTDSGATRVYTGDPRHDGFITGPADDFLGPGDTLIAVEAMSRAQRTAYARWLASPAIVANNDRLPSLLGGQPTDVVPGWGPGWSRSGPAG